MFLFEMESESDKENQFERSCGGRKTKTIQHEEAIPERTKRLVVEPPRWMLIGI